MLLTDFAHPMAIPYSMRRAAAAAAVVLSLARIPGAAEAPARLGCGYCAVELPRMCLWATRCDPPLLLDEAIALVEEAGKEILIVRLRTAFEKASPVTFDWVPADSSQAPLTGLIPALPSGGALALTCAFPDAGRLNVTDSGLVRPPPDPSWIAQRELAIARARAIFSAELWGGLSQ